MQSVENRTLQLETKPKNRISKNSVQPHEGKESLLKHYPRPGLPLQANWILIERKYLIFQQIVQIKNLVSPLLILRPGFIAFILFPMAAPHALSQLNPDRNKIVGVSGTTNFQGASGATTSAVNCFKFGATANMNAAQESSSVSYSDNAAYRQYLRRVLVTTSNQGLINNHNNAVRQ